jgi:hypothetical protein
VETGGQVIFFLIHLLVLDIGFSDSQGFAGASLVDLRGPSCRF